jgi:putative transposase
MTNLIKNIKTYQYRLYPTDEQQAVLDEILNMARWLYNHALAYRRKRWNESRKSVFYDEQAAMWRDWRNEQPEDNPLRLLNMTAGQQVLRRLDKAYRAFFAGKRGKPRFRGWRYFRTVNYKAGDGVSLQNGKLYIQNVGLIQVRFHRELPHGTLKNIILTRKASGWYVAFQVECLVAEAQPSELPAVGIDMGITHALALSDGGVADSPKYLKRAQKKLRRAQRKVARRKKSSKRREKAVKLLAKQHEKIANQRRDWWHKVTYNLVANYGWIAIEDLNLQFMLRNAKLARAAHDVGLGLFTELLTYKAVEAGCQVVRVPAQDTSQMCSGCGEIVEKDLSVRVHDCPHCGLVIDRDINAAINILRRSFLLYPAGLRRSGQNVGAVETVRVLRNSPL